MKYSVYLLVFSCLTIASCSSGSGSNPSVDGDIEIRSTGGIVTEKYRIVEDDEGHFRMDGVYRSWHDSGFPAAEGKLNMGVKEGIFKAWGEDGLLERVVEFKDDKQNGIFKKYANDGKLAEKGEYLKDKKHGEWSYYKEGEVNIIHRYDSDKMVTLNNTQWLMNSGDTLVFSDGEYKILGQNIIGKFDFSDFDNIRFFQGGYRSLDYEITSLNEEKAALARNRRGGLLDMKEISLTKMK